MYHYSRDKQNHCYFLFYTLNSYIVIFPRVSSTVSRIIHTAHSKILCKELEGNSIGKIVCVKVINKSVIKVLSRQWNSVTYFLSFFVVIDKDEYHKHCSHITQTPKLRN